MGLDRVLTKEGRSSSSGSIASVNSLSIPTSKLLAQPIKKNQSRRSKKPFTEEEVQNLMAGMARFKNQWVTILRNYRFNNRTGVDLKDKARNLQKRGLIP